MIVGGFVYALPHGQGAEGEAGDGAGDFVDGGDVAEFVHFVFGEVFQVVELADVDALLDQEVFVDGDEGVAACRRGADFQAAGVAGDEHRAVLFDEVFGRGEGDSG